MLTQAPHSALRGGAIRQLRRIVAMTGLILFGAFTLLACGGGGTGSAGGGSTTPPPREDFINEDLWGEWVGTLVPSTTAKEAYSFYICCDENGKPISGADAKSHDWSVPFVYSYVKVKPDGEFRMIIVDCSDLYTFDGHIDQSGMIITGSYLMLHEGRLEGEGTFSSVISAPGTFSIEDQVAGQWSGTVRNSTGLSKSLAVAVDSFGTILSYVFDGVTFDPLASSSYMSFANDAVGRLDYLSITLSNGSTQSISHLLVDEMGSRLGGAGLVNGVEVVIFSLSKVP